MIRILLGPEDRLQVDIAKSAKEVFVIGVMRGQWSLDTGT